MKTRDAANLFKMMIGKDIQTFIKNRTDDGVLELSKQTDLKYQMISNHVQKETAHVAFVQTEDLMANLNF